MKDATRAYLYGLICGKGYIYKNSFQVAIEFAHSNEFIDGIAHCQNCGYMATKARGADVLRCKNVACQSEVPQSQKRRYEQSRSTKDSIREQIIPFLGENTSLRFAASGNKSVTMLVINFSEERELFDRLVDDFGVGSDYTNVRIPDAMWQAQSEDAVEFFNGVLDATGYANAGSWTPRDGRSGTGRMRLYIQVVRNWFIVSDLDAFIREVLHKPVQTIDWGHPNIRDSNLQDYRESREAAWAREHQLKFFPEYFPEVQFRIRHKQEMFLELLAHNLSCQFSPDNGWFPPRSISVAKRKPHHPGEGDSRLPAEVRRHFDAFWQLNVALGSKSFERVLNEARNPEVYLLTGNPSDGRPVEVVEAELDAIYAKLDAELAPSRTRIAPSAGSVRAERQDLERDTYEPLVKALTTELQAEFGPDVYAYDTSSGNLSNFVSRLSGEQVLELSDWDAFDIRPDVVGFIAGQPRAVFIESKIEPLNLKHLGQLLGYCAAANPLRAVLVSTESLSDSLARAVSRRPDILDYAPDARIKLAQLVNGEIVYSEIGAL